MSHLLSLDPSTKTGWALLKCHPGEDKALHYGTWKLGDDMTAGGYFVALTQALGALCKQHGITSDLQIIIEDKSLNAIGNAWTKHLAESWVGVVETWCEVRGLPAPIAVGVNSWRSAFIGMSKAPKEVGAGLDEKKRPEARRKWIKEAVIRECRKRGLTPADDNQADAVGLLFWHVNGGARVQEQRRANKKAKTAAKRAQKRLDLRAAA